MMRLLVLLGALFACMSSPSSLPSRSAQIHVERGVTYVLSAVAEADGPARGAYDIEVRRQGAAGSSVARQSGAFELLDAGTRTLSTQSVSAAPGDHIVVSLTVTWADGQISRDVLDETVGDAPAR